MGFQPWNVRRAAGRRRGIWPLAKMLFALQRLRLAEVNMIAITGYVIAITPAADRRSTMSCVMLHIEARVQAVLTQRIVAAEMCPADTSRAVARRLELHDHRVGFDEWADRANRSVHSESQEKLAQMILNNRHPGANVPPLFDKFQKWTARWSV